MAATVREPIADWDDAYAQRAHVPDAEEIFAGWERDAPTFRAALGDRARLGLAYAGPRAGSVRERFDLFLPEAVEPQGLVVFIHGGYWMSFDASAWSHLAAGPVARGWAVAMPSYTLAPEAGIPEMTVEAAAAVAAAAQVVAGPVVVTGHSAGGHLACRLLCEDVELGAASGRIVRAVSISGVHDLRPLLRTKINDVLQMTAEVAASESPVLRTPRAGADLVAWTGSAERPEFLRQTALIANIWAGLGARTQEVVVPGRHHFDVIADLAAPESALTAAATGGKAG